ncbi:MAG: c-type cytochrome [Alphaproteobacteria bacterium]
MERRFGPASWFVFVLLTVFGASGELAAESPVLVASQEQTGPDPSVEAPPAPILTRPVRKRCAPEGAAVTGQKEASVCQKCHGFDPGRPSRPTGPNLSAIYGGGIATVADFRNYSDGLKRVREQGLTWDDRRLDEYLKDPRSFLRRITGNEDVKHNMFFKLADGRKRGAIIAYLKSLRSCF